MRPEQDFDRAGRAITLGLLLGLLLALPVPSALADEDGKRTWLGTWGASPQSTVEPLFGPPPPAPVFDDQTLRTIARISKGGDHLRVRFDNSFGAGPLVIGAAHVGLHAGSGSNVAGSDRALSFGGEPGITIPAGAVALSDAAELEVGDLAELTVSLYLPQATDGTSAHSRGEQTAYISPPGDFSGAQNFPVQAMTQARYFLSGIEVLAKRKSLAIVALGDSITDGFASTVDANRRWPDRLAERLAASKKTRKLAVVNAGISGNRVLTNIIGPAALARFDRDVGAVSGAGFVVVLEGINDIGLSVFFPSQEVSADQIIQGYRQLIARAHARCLKIIGATLTPFEGALYFTAAGEAKRQAVNEFIRNGGEFDAVFDFDRVTRDPANPSRFLPVYDSGDNLHPSDAGYAAMADSVDLKVFRKPLKNCRIADD